MVKVDVKGCCGFVDGAKYDAYVGKALDAFDVLVAGNGAGNDFLGWKHLPSETPESLIADCEAIRDDWKAKGVDLVIAIGIGGSYLGAKCAIEALSHNFAPSARSRPSATTSRSSSRRRMPPRWSSPATTCPRNTWPN